MSKDTNFIGHPIFNQLLTFKSKSDIQALAKRHNAEDYVKKFITYNHVVVIDLLRKSF